MTRASHRRPLKPFGIVTTVAVAVGLALALGAAPSVSASAHRFATSPPAAELRLGNPNVRAVALTFDAGSDVGATTTILSTLEHRKIHATFGLTGLWAASNPALVRRIAADGDQIVNHTWDHTSFTGASTSSSPLSAARIRDELSRADALITRLTGHSTKPWFRPPYGDTGAGVDAIAGAAGYRYDLLWTVDSLGWKGVAPATALARVLKSLQPGEIVLMHVGSGSTDAATLPSLITQLEARHYTFETVAQLVRATPRPVFSYAASTLDAARRAWMTGRTWRPGCPVGLSDLRALRLTYWGFDRRPHAGLLIVNARAVGPLVSAFRHLFEERFPIRRMVAVDAVGGDDERSMLADNTSDFNCRLVPGTHVWSQHSYGLAVDVNPFENPEVSGNVVDPPAAWRNADRTRSVRGMIAHGGVAWRAFLGVGWPWGGDWSSPKDYQHFSANGL